jgi:hypothetical protein
MLPAIAIAAVATAASMWATRKRFFLLFLIKKEPSQNPVRKLIRTEKEN